MRTHHFIIVLVALILLPFETYSQSKKNGKYKVSKTKKVGNLRANRNHKVKKTYVAKNNTIKYKSVNHYSRTKVVVVKTRTYRTFNSLPFGHRRFRYGGFNYYHHAGFCYGYYNNVYRIQPFPRGFRINVLPIGYHTIIYQSTPRYYYAGTYYVKENNTYKTEAPEIGMVVPNLPEADLEEVKMNDVTYYEYDDILYKPVEKDGVTQYEVAGSLGD
jgi:Family of unknown function (DUF6515)